MGASVSWSTSGMKARLISWWWSSRLRPIVAPNIADLSAWALDHSFWRHKDILYTHFVGGAGYLCRLDSGSQSHGWSLFGIKLCLGPPVTSIASCRRCSVPLLFVVSWTTVLRFSLSVWVFKLRNPTCFYPSKRFDTFQEEAQKRHVR